MNNNQLAVVRESAQLIPQPTAELIEKSFAQKHYQKPQARPTEVWRAATGTTDHRGIPR